MLNKDLPSKPSVINPTKKKVNANLKVKKRTKMLHSEVETVRAHHGSIGSNNSHQTSPTLAQKTPFAIQEL